jgi:CRP-like cAMP-binding protein
VLHRNQKLELLKSVPLFAGCSKKELAQIGLIADEIDLPQGTELTREGTKGREFFVLVEGTADVKREGRTINTMRAGDFFGEVALVTNTPRTATVTAATPLDVLVITARDFERLIVENPLIALKVMRAVVERVPDDAFQ